MNVPLTEGVALLIVILVGFLPTEIWRSLAVLAGRRVEEGSELFHWVGAVAAALLAAVVARLLLSPAGALMAIPLIVRLGAVAGGVAAFFLARRSVLTGVVVGEILLLAAAAWYDSL